MKSRKLQHSLIGLQLLGILLVAAGVSGCRPPRDTIILITATPANGVFPNDVGGGNLPPLVGNDGGSTGIDATPTFIPTPNPTRQVVVDVGQDQVYVVLSGDTLNLISQRFGVSLDSLVAANGFPDENVLIYPGQTLTIPQAVQAFGPPFKIIPDGELVYGPNLRGFRVEEYLKGRGGYLESYTEELNGRTWTGPQIVERVGLEQSVSTRLLLAALEYESHWLTQASLEPSSILYPMNYTDQPAQTYGLYRQLDWAAKLMNTGYYGWRQRGMTATLLADGARAGLDPTLNAGTAGVQVWLSQTRTLESWQNATSYSGFFATYVALFGDPFRGAVEPLIPRDLTQPPMVFPWASDETWYYTGGPHGAWGSGSAWAAVDFVTGAALQGCEPSPGYARAVADGVIARNEFGVVILDLDGDGFEGTGWTVFYLHLTSEDRKVVAGQRVKAGDPIGHPACEGGVSYATHLHIARRYNGEWMAADCTQCMLESPAPSLNFNGWQAYSFGTEYDGSFVEGDEYREACTCREQLNTLSNGG